MIEQFHFSVSRKGIAQPFSAYDGWGAFLGWMDDSAAQIGWDRSDPIFPGWALETHILDDHRFFFRATQFVQWMRDKPSWIREYLRGRREWGWIDGTRGASGEPVRELGGGVTLVDVTVFEQMRRRASELIAASWRGLSRQQRGALVACYERGLSLGECPGLARSGARR